MRVVCVDDEPIVLEEVSGLVEKHADVTSVTAFLSPEEALAWAENNVPDVAFLDINLGRMDGLMLAKHLREMHPDCAIVFLTGYSEYAVSAFQLHAEGYLMKPATMEDVWRELDYIKSKRPIPAPQSENPIRVQCFGNFEVYANDAPLHFERAKTKELLAYLVDCQGAQITMGELIGILWEDAADTHSMRGNLRNLIHDLKNTLANAGAENVLIKDRNTISINCAAIDCDFYDFLKRKVYAVNRYRGEYMSQYSWAELTTASISMS